MADKAKIEELRSLITEAQAAGGSGGSGEPKTVRPRRGTRRKAAETSSGAGGPADDALSKIVRILNAGEKSSSQVKDRLLRSGFSEEAAEEALAKAIDYGIVDDARYAEMLVRSRVAQGRGLAGIARELQQNGIDPLAVEGWPDAFVQDSGDEVARALDFVRRHPPNAKNKREAAYRKLVQKGYSSSASASAARTWAEEAGW